MSNHNKSNKTKSGNYFEDFYLGQKIKHATPRTITYGDITNYSSLYGMRFAVNSSSEFAKKIGYKNWPLDDLLVFHIVFGKTVPDISLNAIANLGYADCKFIKHVYVNDTIYSISEVIGLKENSNKKTGIIYVRTTGFNQDDEKILEYIRWVMVRKRDVNAIIKQEKLPVLPKVVDIKNQDIAVPMLKLKNYDTALSGSGFLYDDYELGEKIDHVDGMCVEEAEHQIATRLYQNTAKVHFNQHLADDTPFKRRIIYGGHVISLSRALSFNGLANCFHIAAINGGRHVSPLFAAKTVYAWSEILDKSVIKDRDDIGALRIKTYATQDYGCKNYPDLENKNLPDKTILLELDYWAIIPRK